MKFPIFGLLVDEVNLCYRQIIFNLVACKGKRFAPTLQILRQEMRQQKEVGAGCYQPQEDDFDKYEIQKPVANINPFIEKSKLNGQNLSILTFAHAQARAKT